jgi:hypothetical protein
MPVLGNLGRNNNLNGIACTPTDRGNRRKCDLVFRRWHLCCKISSRKAEADDQGNIAANYGAYVFHDSLTSG